MTTAKKIRLHILENITNGFSVDSIIGTGGYGNVYKGDYDGEPIAVKLLHDDLAQLLDDTQFNNEVVNLLRVEHPNIVRLRGYCHETHSEYVEHNGKDRLSRRIYRVLCFEYLPCGSLDKHLCAQSFAPNWSTRYNIIKGICEGLNFLHGREPQILHRDLKPANILLDNSMVPKVADFGLSRVINRSQTHVTKNLRGTEKYMPPEFIEGGKFSTKYDIFSLGVVMIEIMAGSSGYSSYTEMDDVAQFIQQVLTNCSTMIEATSKYRSEELHQVMTCIGLAMQCVDSERNNRPSTVDILDALKKTEVNIPKSQLANMPVYPAMGPKNTMANTVKMMADELDHIRSKHRHHNFMPKYSFNFNAQQVPDIRETSSSMEESFIIGRTDEKQKILSILSDRMAGEMIILPIYGIGGIGKTTLAQLVFHDTQFHEYSRVWVYVSQEFDLNKIGNSIVSQLTKEVSHIADKQMLHSRLGELFAGKNILIVLDDLWEDKPYELDKLKIMLMPHLGTKVIIVTTRDEAIAMKIRRNRLPYKLEVLTDDMCWTIIKQKSSFEDLHDKEQMEQTGRDIAIKCGGVALAAQSLGYMLRDMTSDQWELVRDSYIWNLSSVGDPSLRNHEVLASLLLSYSHMPDCLKLCFAYCSVFPKGYNIVKYDLIHQWIALGFAEPYGIFDSMQLCEKYVTQLLGMSFLQYSKKPSSDGRRDKEVTLFTMHDLVHDLARAMLADKVNEKGNHVGSSCNYALLTDCSKPLQLSVSSTENTRFKYISTLFQKRISPKNIKALRFVDCGNLWLRGGAFSPAEFLLVLDLSECFIQKLPNSIGRLKHLRFLHAPRIQYKMIPNCITELSELNYLNLRESNISALPESIGDMKGLMHLDLSYCRKVRELPVSFANLKQLVHLDLSYCNTSITETFGGFTKLQYLNLSVMFGEKLWRMLPEVIRNLNKLRYLNLSGCIDAMMASMHTQYDLYDTISTFSNLEHLDLSRNKWILSIPESMGNLRKLHTLDLLGCSQLKKLPDSMVNMVSLKVLKVDMSVTLDESVLSLLNVASLPHFMVHASSDKCSSNIILLQPTNPDKLTINRLEKVKSAVEAQSIKLIDKQKIKDLKFQWTVAAARFMDDKEVLENLVPPNSVEKIFIYGYRSASIPDWLMGITQYLPNLSNIYLRDFPNCKNLPPLGELPNLQMLGLCRLESLEEWNTAYTSGKVGVNELMFPKLEKLTIKHCAKLRIKPCLPRAMYLSIVDCDNVLSSWEEGSSHSCASSSSPITDLSVKYSNVPLCQWWLLHHLPAIRSLSITSCDDLTTSPEILKHLSSLETLSLQELYKNAEISSWFVEMTSLQSLTLFDCTGIRSLPDSIQQLSKLEYLDISGCPTLEKWCKSEENKMKLAHIECKNIGQLYEEETFIETTNNVDTESG